MLSFHIIITQHSTFAVADTFISLVSAKQTYKACHILKIVNQEIFRKDCFVSIRFYLQITFISMKGQTAAKILFWPFAAQREQ